MRSRLVRPGLTTATALALLLCIGVSAEGATSLPLLGEELRADVSVHGDHSLGSAEAQVEGMDEVPEQRSAYQKVYRDRTDPRKQRALVGSAPLHYRAPDGSWQDIERVFERRDDGSLDMAKHTFRTVTPARVGDAPLMTVTWDGTSVASGRNMRLFLESVAGDATPLLEVDRDAVGEPSGDTVTYRGALGGDVVVEVNPIAAVQKLWLPSVPFFPGDAAEDSILVWSEEITLEGGIQPWLDGEPVPDGTTRSGIVLELRDLAADLIVYEVGVPVAFEADDEGGMRQLPPDDPRYPLAAVAVDGEFRVTRTGNRIVLEKLFPASWFTAEERQYPVVVDPTLTPTVRTPNSTRYTGIVWRRDGTFGGNYHTLLEYGAPYYSSWTGDRLRLYSGGTASQMKDWLRFDISGLYRYLTSVGEPTIHLYLDYQSVPTSIHFADIALDVCAHDHSTGGTQDQDGLAIFNAINGGYDLCTTTLGSWVTFQWHTVQLGNGSKLASVIKAARAANQGWVNVGLDMAGETATRDVRFRDRQHNEYPKLVFSYVVECTSAAHCNDNISCTVDSCDSGRCLRPISSSYCYISGVCRSSGYYVNQCQYCNPASSQTSWTTHTGRACNDGNSCTKSDTCKSNATCSGTAYTCNDGKSCTTDTCNGSGGCNYSLQSDKCLIGNVCYNNRQVNPSNPCQECRRDWAAQYATQWGYDNANSCSDGQICTYNDRCSSGSCVGTGYSCNDGRSCTADSCNGAGGCTNSLIAGNCLISGTCYTNNQANPGNPCQYCSTSWSTSAWRPRPNGSTPRACFPCPSGSPTGRCKSGTQTCSGGAYGACTGYVCPVGEACNGVDDDCDSQIDEGTNGSCDDGRSCTNDYCSGGTCRHDVTSTTCLISGVCYNAGQRHPANECLYCDPGRNRTNWSARAGGYPCSADSISCTDDVCNGSGSCTHPIKSTNCLISGTCYNNGAANGQCHKCVPATSKTSWTVTTGATCSDGQPCTKSDTCKSNGACTGTAYTCNDGKDCTSDVCNGSGGCSYPIVAGRCLISGACYNSGGVNPGNSCQQCTPGSSNTGWSPRAAGSACTADAYSCTSDVCNSSGTCTHPLAGNKCLIGGTCYDAGTIQPGSICNWCDPTKSTSAWSPRPNGTSCTGDGLSCTNDICNGAGACTHPIQGNTCLISGTCYSNHANDPSNQCRWCEPTQSQTAFRNKPNGQACSGDAYSCTSDICNGSGSCTHPVNNGTCLIGGACYTTNQPNPGNICQWCASSNKTAWTARPSGTACTTDNLTCTDDVCNGASSCVHNLQSGKCLIGGACYNNGAANGQCHECRSATSTTTWTYITNKACNDSNSCSHTDVCKAGGTGCDGTDYSCDDGKGCTNDTCDGAGGCANTRIAGWCLIGGTCYQDDALNPTNDCKWCDPAASGTTWTNRSSGASCKTDNISCTNDICNGGGTCTHPVTANFCRIDNACWPANATKPGMKCLGCRPGVSQTAWSNMPSGSACESDSKACTDDICNGSGVCQHPIQSDKCLVSGQCYANADLNPANECTWCAPTRSQTAWTNRSNTTACTADAYSCTVDRCNGSGACIHPVASNKCLVAGQCYNDDATNPESDCTWCDPSKTRTAWSDKPSGMTCADEGKACTNDVCDGGGTCVHPIKAANCLISGSCYDDRDLNPSDACGWCDPDLTQTGWSNSPDGTVCPDDGLGCTNDVCNGAGTCAHRIKPANCLIGGLCYDNQDRNPSEDCDWCNPTLTQTAWSSTAAGLSCPDEGLGCTNDVCNGTGTCTHPIKSDRCLIGGTCFADGDDDFDNLCMWCDPAVEHFDWTNKPSGATCPDDSLVCTRDVCDGHGVCVHPIRVDDCLVDGVCYDAAQTSPMNQCDVCTPVGSQVSFSHATGPLTAPAGEGPMGSPVINGAIVDTTGAEWAGLQAATNSVTSDWGAGNALSKLYVAVDQRNLYLGIRGNVGADNTIIAYIDLDTSKSDGFSATDQCSDNGGTSSGGDSDLDDAICWSSGETGARMRFTAANFKPDVVFGTRAMNQYVDGAACPNLGWSDMAGWRKLMTGNNLPWLCSRVRTDKDAGVIETSVPLTQLYAAGIPEAGLEIAVAVRVINWNGGFASNQGLPAHPTGTGVRQVVAVHRFRVQPTTNPVPWPSGWSGSGAKACSADSFDCTIDVCDGFGGCGHVVEADNCMIGGHCLPVGFESGMCKECQPADNQVDWTWMTGKACDDGESCTHTDKCLPDLASCGGTEYGCADGLDCTEDICSGDGSCENALRLGFCLVAGTCYDPEDQSPANPCLWCDPDHAATAWTNVPDDTIDGTCYPCTASAPNVGECRAGVKWCTNGSWGPCAGHVCPRAERCNELDDDCDTSIDEDWPAKGTACDGGDRDLCTGGTQVCKPDFSGLRCEDGPVAFYPMDEGAGAAINPAQGLTSSGAVHGAQWTQGGSNQTPALLFDGADDYVSVPAHASLNATTGLTVSAWIRRAATGGDAWQAIAGRFDGGSGGFLLAVNPAQGPGLSVWLGAACGWRYSNVVPPAATWIHVAATYDGSTAKIYLDGAEVGSQACAGNGGKLASSTAPLTIGGLLPTAPLDASFSGAIDEVSVYTSALAASQIKSFARFGDHCDAIDNDCNGATDEALYPDLFKGTAARKSDTCDGDDYDLCVHGTYTCAANGLAIECENEDPDEIPEACNGLDDDCHGDLPANEHDDDNDGFMICEGDCDDQSVRFNPAHLEICDGFDNNCDSVLPVAEQDLDDDKHLACIPGEDSTHGQPLEWADCDDANPLVHKDAPEYCNDIDDDCDGLVDMADPSVLVFNIQSHAPIGAASGQTLEVLFRGTNFRAGSGTDITVDFGYGITVQNVDVQSREVMVATIQIAAAADVEDPARLHAPRDITLRQGSTCYETLPDAFDVFDPTEVPDLTFWGTTLLAGLLLLLGFVAIRRRRIGFGAAALLTLALLWPRVAAAECGGIGAATELSGVACADLTAAGCCLDQTVVWCADPMDDVVCGLDCGLNATPPYDSCGYDANYAWYDCGFTGTNAENPRDCPFACEPDCAGRVCGADGCGGTCGAGCGAGLVCTAGGQCAPPATCTSAGPLACTAGGTVVSGDTGSGGDQIDQHSGCATWDETGPEVAYTFTAASNDRVAFLLATAAGTDLDLFLLEGTCDGLSCVASADAELVADVTAGTTYYVVVDGFRGAQGAYTLTMRCASEYVPNCAGRQCGPDGGPFGNDCGTCGGGTPFCREETGQCEAEGCHGIAADGCCDGAMLKRCTDNRIETVDCALESPWLPDCGYFDGGDTGTPGYFCGFENDGSGDCACSAAPAACDPGWECGVDACGDPCGDGCPRGQMCAEHACVPAPSCIETALPFDCDADPYVIESTTAGGPAAIDGYPRCVAWDESGPESVFSFVAADDTWFSVELEAFDTDLDLFVMAGGCGGDFCVASGDGGAAWQGEAGVTYYLSVDGYQGGEGRYRMLIHCQCTPSCDGKSCGEDGCGGSCGTCPAGGICFEDMCCTPNCNGRVCGDDGCGGTCGTCDEAAGSLCRDGACFDYGSWCDQLGVEGCCESNRAFWCDGAEPAFVECDTVCGWDDLFGFYTCGGAGPDPTYTAPMSCPWDRVACETDADCDDSEPLTADICVGGACASQPCQCSSAAQCDDADEATTDLCVGCLCEHEVPVPCDPPDCADDDPCTTDSCQEGGVCSHDLVEDCCREDADCHDTSDCTLDACVGNVCVFTPLEDCCTADDECADDDPCTVDACVTTVCVNTEALGCCREDAECEDGDPCTADVCTDNACASTEIEECCRFDGDCNDDNSCTLDACINNACSNQALPDCCVVDEDCDDGSACTDDVCSVGTCFSIEIDGCCESDTECDDGDGCTTDTCTDNACASEPIENCCERDAECWDGNPCTDDFCDAGTCSNERREPCCVGDTDCNDDDPCTVDSCSNMLCMNEAIPNCCREDADCLDEDNCTVDTCLEGLCQRDPKDCDDEDACTVDSCEDGVCRNRPVECNDDNECTADSCAEGECVNTPIPDCGACTPECGGKACGDDDGCGTPCQGTCPAGETCSADAVCVSVGDDVVVGEDTPVGEDTQVGEDIATGEDTPAGDDTGTPDDTGSGGDDTAAQVDTGGSGEVSPSEDTTQPVGEDTVPAADEGGGGGGGGGCSTGQSTAPKSALPAALLLLMLTAVLATVRRSRPASSR